MELHHLKPTGKIIGIVSGVLIGSMLAFYGLILFWPQGNPYDSITIDISKGSSVKEIGHVLHTRSVIRSEKAFLWGVRALGVETEIPAGSYKLIHANSNYRIIDQLVNGAPVLKRVTILEGWTMNNIAEELHRKLGVSKRKFMNVCRNNRLLNEFGVNANSFEGYLFPETYFFPEDEDPEFVVRSMASEFRKNFSPHLKDRMNEIGLTELETITLASIIEGEALYHKERATISGVYHNRMKKGMRLQADPTIQYIIDDSPRRLLNEDLKIKSPYNTYLNPGLPPGPINNPGKASIVAALYPEQNPYLYFVARGDGYHTFSKTEKEHNRAKRKFQKIRRQAQKAKRKNNLSKETS